MFGQAYKPLTLAEAFQRLEEYKLAVSFRRLQAEDIANYGRQRMQFRANGLPHPVSPSPQAYSASSSRGASQNSASGGRARQQSSTPAGRSRSSQNNATQQNGNSNSARLPTPATRSSSQSTASGGRTRSGNQFRGTSTTNTVEAESEQEVPESAAAGTEEGETEVNEVDAEPTMTKRQRRRHIWKMKQKELRKARKLERKANKSQANSSPSKPKSSTTTKSNPKSGQTKPGSGQPGDVSRPAPAPTQGQSSPSASVPEPTATTASTTVAAATSTTSSTSPSNGVEIQQGGVLPRDAMIGRSAHPSAWNFDPSTLGIRADITTLNFGEMGLQPSASGIIPTFNDVDEYDAHDVSVVEEIDEKDERSESAVLVRPNSWRPDRSDSLYDLSEKLVDIYEGVDLLLEQRETDLTPADLNAMSSTSGTGDHGCPYVFVRIGANSVHALVDTGARFGLIRADKLPEEYLSTLRKTRLRLRTAFGGVRSALGWVTIPVTLPSGVTFTSEFLLVEGSSHPLIIGSSQLWQLASTMDFSGKTPKLTVTVDEVVHNVPLQKAPRRTASPSAGIGMIELACTDCESSYSRTGADGCSRDDTCLGQESSH